MLLHVTLCCLILCSSVICCDVFLDVVQCCYMLPRVITYCAVLLVLSVEILHDVCSVVTCCQGLLHAV